MTQIIKFDNKAYKLTKKSNLSNLANNIAKSYQDKGAIIITSNENGDIRIGTNGLTPNELRECLCTAIHYSFVFEPDE